MKYEEKIAEKSPNEKWERDPLSLIIWAAILIWTGLVFLLSRTWPAPFADFRTSALAGLSTWSLILLGVSLILLAEVAIRLLFPAYRRPVLGTAILAFILLGLGLNSWILIWPAIIILIGITVLVRALSRRK